MEDPARTEDLQQRTLRLEAELKDLELPQETQVRLALNSMLAYGGQLEDEVQSAIENWVNRVAVDSEVLRRMALGEVTLVVEGDSICVVATDDKFRNTFVSKLEEVLHGESLGTDQATEDGS